MFAAEGRCTVRQQSDPFIAEPLYTSLAMWKRFPISLFLAGVCLMAWPVSSHAQSTSPKAPVLLVVNQGAKDLSVIDPGKDRQIATISEDMTAMHGHEVAVSPDGQLAYVPIYGSTGVGKPGLDGREMLVIDIPARKIIHHVDFGHGVRPHCVIYNRHDKLLYVTTELDQDVTIIDPRTLKIVGTIPTARSSLTCSPSRTMAAAGTPPTSDRGRFQCWT